MSTAKVIPLPELRASQQVAATIRAEMARNGVTPQELAAALGITRQAVSYKIRGKRSISIDELDAIAPLFGMTLVELVADAKNPRPRRGENGGSEEARPKGLEPPTFWLGAFLGEDELADVVDLAERRAPAPARGWESESLAPVLDLTARLDERAS